MKQIIVFIVALILGFLIAERIYKKENNSKVQEDTRVMMYGIHNMSKLIVSEGIFSEVYNYRNAKKYFYDTFEFKKSVIVTVNARVQVSFDLEKMDVELDSVHKRIIIRSIPEEEISIIPDVKYFDLQQSTFNTFDKDELNRINKRSIEKIRETAEVSKLKSEARRRLIEELSKIYQLSNILGWKVVDETNLGLLDSFEQGKPKF